MRFERDVASGVHRIEDGAVNFYIVEDDSGITVVDAAHPASWRTLRDALGTIGRTLGEIQAVVITHAHFDHVGFARRAQKEQELPVLCPHGDRELAGHPWRYASTRSRLPYLAHPGFLAVLARMTVRGAPLTRGFAPTGTFGAGEELDVPGRPRVVGTPGHTFGHSALHLPDRDVVLSGDALVTLDPYTSATGPRLVARAATADVEQSLRSLDALAATGARTVLPGHGEPWRDGVEAAAAQAREHGSA